MAVEVGIRDLRSKLSYWIDRAADGEEVVVTERGRPKVRLLGVGQKTTLQRLIEEGLVTPAERPDGKLPKPIRIRGSSSDLLDDSRGRY